MKSVTQYLKKMIPTLLIIGATIVLSCIAYIDIMQKEEEKCWQTLDDSARILNDEIRIRFTDNINILKLASGAMVQEGRVESYDAIVSHVNAFQHLTIFSQINVLYPDDMMLMQNGTRVNVGDQVSFSEIAAKGEHMSVRCTDIESEKQVVNYYVPVVKEDQILAVLVGVIDCMELPDIFSAKIYDGKAISCIVDYSDGSFIMDDWHDELANMFEMEQRKTLKKYEDVDLIEDVRNAKTGVIAYASKVNGLDSYMYYTPIGIFNWELLLILQEDVVFESLLNLKKTLMVVAMVETCLLVFYFFWNLIILNRLSKNKREAEKQLQTSTTLIECVTELTSYSDIDEAIYNLLGIINQYFKGNRTYLFQIDYDKKTTSNIYEHVRAGTKKERNNLQNIPLEQVTAWLDKFKEAGAFYISDKSKDESIDSQTYHALALHDIKSFLAVALIENDNMIGFIGINDPTMHVEELQLLNSIRFFVMDSLKRKREQEMLTCLSYNDALTQIYNRNKFNHILEEYGNQNFEKVGVAYFDLNGLKKINDQLGHSEGDALIRNVAKGIDLFFPKSTFRIGGDEFAVIISNVEKEAFEKRIEEARLYMEEHHMSISYGTSWSAYGDNLASQLKKADEMMYQNKADYYNKSGNNQRR